MSNSVDFCKSRLPLVNFSDCHEIKTTFDYIETIFPKSVFDGNDINLIIKGTTKDGEKIRFEVCLEYNPDCSDFNYCTIESFLGDGTAAFTVDACVKVISKVACGNTYNINVGIPQNGDKIKYTYGNFVVANEFSTKFATKEKPWLMEKTTVALPLKMEKL